MNSSSSETYSSWPLVSASYIDWFLISNTIVIPILDVLQTFVLRQYQHSTSLKVSNLMRMRTFRRMTMILRTVVKLFIARLHYIILIGYPDINHAIPSVGFKEQSSVALALLTTSEPHCVVASHEAAAGQGRKFPASDKPRCRHRSESLSSREPEANA
jgi:hypothetical protein